MVTGKTATLNIPYIELDTIFWKPGGYNEKREDPDIEADLKKIQGSDNWRAEGVFGHLGDYIVPFADTLVYTDLPWDECKRNLINRGPESSRQTRQVSLKI